MAMDLLMVLLHRGDVATVGLNLWVYVFHLALFGILGGVMVWVQRQSEKAKVQSANTGVGVRE